jgi:hypothetical protein
MVAVNKLILQNTVPSTTNFKQSSEQRIQTLS